MHNGTRHNQFRSVWSMSVANFDSWLHSPRTYLMLLFLIALCFLQTHTYNNALIEKCYSMHFTETMFFHFNTGCNIGIASMLFLVMVNEIPLRLSFQNNMLIRSNRFQWLIAQLLYCFMMVIFMLVLLFVFIAVFSLPVISPGSGWSDLDRVASGKISLEEAIVKEYFLKSYTPFTALITAFLPLFFFWITMLMVILACSLMGAEHLGVMVYAFLLVANVTILYEVFPGLTMPLQYATLKSIVAPVQGQEGKRILFVVAAYLIIDVVLVATMFLFVKKNEMRFEEKQ